jgi:hypothetical protein
MVKYLLSRNYQMMISKSKHKEGWLPAILLYVSDYFLGLDSAPNASVVLYFSGKKELRTSSRSQS